MRVWFGNPLRPAKGNMEFKTHLLVPEHRIMDEAEVKRLLERYNINRNQLPKIKLNDAAFNFLSRQPEIGNVIEIKRESVTSGTTYYYRIVVEG